jgi:hypothetical protein
VGKRIERAALPAYLITASLLLTLCLGAVLLRWRNQRATLRGKWPAFLEMVIAILVGLQITAFLAWQAYAGEKRGREEIFIRLAASETAGLVDAMRSLRDFEMAGLAAFMGLRYHTF